MFFHFELIKVRVTPSDNWSAILSTPDLSTIDAAIVWMQIIYLSAIFFTLQLWVDSCHLSVKSKACVFCLISVTSSINPSQHLANDRFALVTVPRRPWRGLRCHAQGLISYNFIFICLNTYSLQLHNITVGFPNLCKEQWNIRLFQIAHLNFWRNQTCNWTLIN